MLQKHRGTLGLLALAALTLGAAAIGGIAWCLYLPHPSQSSRPQLVRWLVLRDLEQESLEIRLALVDRLQQLLEENFADHAAASSASLSQPHRRQLERNCTLLQHDWFVQRAHQSQQLEGPPRVAFLDRQIDTLVLWCRTQQHITNQEPDADSTGSSNAGFFDQLESWMQSAAPEQRPVLAQAVTDGLICWLARDDLRDYPLEFRQDLAERLALSLDQGATGEGLLADLPPDRRDRLVANCQCLLEAWFLNRAAEYQQLANQQRAAYVDTQLTRLSAWNLSTLIPPGERSDDHGAAWLALHQLVEEWVQRAEPEQRRGLRRLSTHMQQRLLLNKLRELNLLPQPSGGAR